MLPDRKILLGLDFTGLAEFLLFLLLILALLIWVVYKLAAIIVPAALIVLLGLVATWFPFVKWEQATIGARSQRSISACLDEIKTLERTGVAREQIVPLERRAKEAAQALTDSAYTRFRRVSARNTKDGGRRRAGKPVRRPYESEQRRRQERVLKRELEDLRLTHGVVPDPDPWRRLYHLHLQRGWFRWMVEHPRGAGMMIMFGIVLLVAAVAGVFSEYG